MPLAPGAEEQQRQQRFSQTPCLELQALPLSLPLHALVRARSVVAAPLLPELGSTAGSGMLSGALSPVMTTMSGPFDINASSDDDDTTSENTTTSFKSPDTNSAPRSVFKNHRITGLNLACLRMLGCDKCEIFADALRFVKPGGTIVSPGCICR